MAADCRRRQRVAEFCRAWLAQRRSGGIKSFSDAIKQATALLTSFIAALA